MERPGADTALGLAQVAEEATTGEGWDDAGVMTSLTSLWTDAVGAVAGMPPALLAFALAVVALGYCVLGLVGFGSALIAVPLLSWFWPLTVVVPLLLLIDVAASALHTGLNLQRVAWREIPPLAPGVVLGCVAALWVLHALDGPWLLVVLGAYVVLVGVRGLRGQPMPLAGAGGTRAVSAFLMGLVEALYGTAGPVVVAWLSQRVNDAQALRATVPTTMVLISLIALVGAATAGYLVQPAVLGLLLVLLPWALVCVTAGHWLSSRVPAALLRRATWCLLVASGLALAGRALWRTLV